MSVNDVLDQLQKLVDDNKYISDFNVYSIDSDYIYTFIAQHRAYEE